MGLENFLSDKYIFEKSISLNFIDYFIYNYLEDDEYLIRCFFFFSRSSFPLEVALHLFINKWIRMIYFTFMMLYTVMYMSN